MRNWIHVQDRSGSAGSAPGRLSLDLVELTMALLDAPVHLRHAVFDEGPAVWRRHEENEPRPRLVLVHDALPVRPDSGALRFVPGSHALPATVTAAELALLAHADPRSCRDAIGGVVATTGPRDVLVFDAGIWHLRPSASERTALLATTLVNDNHFR